jgi:hypothetical protein
MTYQKTNIPGYVKDEKTNLIVNRNTQQYDQYLAGKKQALEINRLNKKVETMGSELTEIKDLLRQLLNKAT